MFFKTFHNVAVCTIKELKAKMDQAPRAQGGWVGVEGELRRDDT